MYTLVMIRSNIYSKSDEKVHFTKLYVLYWGL